MGATGSGPVTPASSPRVSPDGSTLLQGQSGSLVTSAGTWTFGTDHQSYGTNVLLNGVSAAGGYGTELEVANGGNLYESQFGTSWWRSEERGVGKQCGARTPATAL